MRRFLGPLIVIAILGGIFALVASDLLSGGFAEEFDELTDRTTDEVLTRLDEDEGFTDVQVFDVQADGSLDPAATGRAAEVWELWLDLAGASNVAATITQYRVGEAPTSSALAYVYQDRGIRQFTLAVNLAATDEDDILLSTLVHEWSHVVSLGVNQFEPSSLEGDVAGCATIPLVQGCLTEQSYLWQFYAEFWTAYPKHPDVENRSPVTAEAFYAENTDDFVSGYAATNLSEDFAESFTAFVAASEDDTLDGLGDVATAKVTFFDRFPELVALRDQMRAVALAQAGVR